MTSWRHHRRERRWLRAAAREELAHDYVTLRCAYSRACVCVYRYSYVCVMYRGVHVTGIRQSHGAHVLLSWPLGPLHSCDRSIFALLSIPALSRGPVENWYLRGKICIDHGIESPLGGNLLVYIVVLFACGRRARSAVNGAVLCRSEKNMKYRVIRQRKIYRNYLYFYNIRVNYGRLIDNYSSLDVVNYILVYYIASEITISIAVVVVEFIINQIM